MAELIRQIRTSKLAPAVALALALAILGATIWLGTDRLRRSVRAQMVNRDGEILYAVAQAQQFADSAQTALGTRLQNPEDQLALALEISRLKEGVLAVRLYDATGAFVTAFPPYVSEAPLSGATFRELEHLRPLSHYLGKGRLADWFLTEPAGEAGATTPLLEVNIPIHARDQQRLLAAAQLIVDARHLEASLAKVERELWHQALAAFLAGGALLSAAGVWAYRRLQRSQALLRERTARLLRANHELTLAAKTGVLGAVAAHLVHGLSNPLASLQFIMAGRSHPADHDWQDVAAATQQMQKLVHEVVRVLGEENATDHYEISLAELAEILSAKVQPVAQGAAVGFALRGSAEGKLSNHHANLVLLVLENLVRNALQVTPRGQQVEVSLARDGSEVVFEVTDAGPGFPPHLLKNLFMPCRSTKGGSGLGLAISQRLAGHLGARLELKSTGPAGCVFSLALPRALWAGEAESSAPVPASGKTLQGNRVVQPDVSLRSGVPETIGPYLAARSEAVSASSPNP